MIRISQGSITLFILQFNIPNHIFVENNKNLISTISSFFSNSLIIITKVILEDIHRMKKNNDEIIRLIKFAETVRESTLKRLRKVDWNEINWRPAANLMSFADVAGHIIDSDEWMIKKLKTKNLEPIDGYPNSVLIENKEQYNSLIERLEKILIEKNDFLKSLSDDNLKEKIYDSRFDGEVSVWWIIVRGNLDHEIHHRGQIAAYLGILKNL